jgi:hypothetical protein
MDLAKAGVYGSNVEEIFYLQMGVPEAEPRLERFVWLIAYGILQMGFTVLGG